MPELARKAIASFRETDNGTACWPAKEGARAGRPGYDSYPRRPGKLTPADGAAAAAAWEPGRPGADANTPGQGGHAPHPAAPQAPETRRHRQLVGLRSRWVAIRTAWPLLRRSGDASDGTVASLGVVTLSGLIRLEARLVLAGVRHETVPAYATYHAARHRIILRLPILRQSR